MVPSAGGVAKTAMKRKASRKLCIACKRLRPRGRFRAGPDGLETLCIICFRFYAVKLALPIFQWPNKKVSVVQVPGSVRITKYRMQPRLPDEEDVSRFLKPDILALEPGAPALEEFLDNATSRREGQGANLAPTGREGPQHPGVAERKPVSTGDFPTAWKKEPIFAAEGVRKMSIKRKVPGGNCKACNCGVRRRLKLLPGPDGSHALCWSCFKSYSRERLPIFLLPSKKVSVVQIHGSMLVTKYHILPRTIDSDDINRFLFPVILEVDSGASDLRKILKSPDAQDRDIGGSGQNCCPKGRPQEASEQLGKLDLPAQLGVPSRRLFPVDGRSQTENGAFYDLRQILQKSADIRQRLGSRQLSSNDGDTLGQAGAADCHCNTGHSAGICLPTTSSAAQRAAASAVLPRGVCKTENVMMKAARQHGRPRTSARGCRGIPQWPMPSFDSSGRARAGVCDERPTGTFYPVKATLGTPEGKDIARRFSVPADASFEAFEETLAGLFGLRGPFAVSYRDEDGDEVKVASSNELAEMLVVSSGANVSPVRVSVVVTRQGRGGC